MPEKYIKLPNGEVVVVDGNGNITVEVVAELSDFIQRDLEGVLDFLSNLATGTDLLSNTSYSVVASEGNSLTIHVSGGIDMIEDAEVIPEEQLPSCVYEVQVTRVSYGRRTIRLTARTLQEAMDIADDDAGNHTYSEHSSEYRFEAHQV